MLEVAVDIDYELPRALRAIADFNKQGLKEAPQPTNNEETNDRAEVLDESIDLGRHESTAIDDGLDGTWNISGVYFDAEPEEPLRRGTRNRHAPVKFEYDVIGDPNVNIVNVRRFQQSSTNL